jgi:transcriptional regulator with XRE-family HTH domain
VRKHKTIRELREERGWTQLQLAVALNVSLSAVQGWESGRNEPRASQLRRIADLFGVLMDDIQLVGEEPEGKVAA